MTQRMLTFTDASGEDYLYWQGQDKKTLRRINELIRATLRTPFEGIGKPEPLLGNLSRLWSCRIDQANRLVYDVSEARISIVSCLYHYQADFT
jgi:toxin YoeB